MSSPQTCPTTCASASRRSPRSPGSCRTCSAPSPVAPRSCGRSSTTTTRSWSARAACRRPSGSSSSSRPPGPTTASYCVVAHGAILRIRAKDTEIADRVATNPWTAPLPAARAGHRRPRPGPRHRARPTVGRAPRRRARRGARRRRDLGRRRHHRAVRALQPDGAPDRTGAEPGVLPDGPHRCAPLVVTLSTLPQCYGARRHLHDGPAMARLAGRRAAILSYRLGMADGVSVTAAQWATRPAPAGHARDDRGGRRAGRRAGRGARDRRAPAPVAPPARRRARTTPISSSSTTSARCR